MTKDAGLATRTPTVRLHERDTTLVTTMIKILNLTQVCITQTMVQQKE